MKRKVLSMVLAGLMAFSMCGSMSVQAEKMTKSNWMFGHSVDCQQSLKYSWKWQKDLMLHRIKSM